MKIGKNGDNVNDAVNYVKTGLGNVKAKKIIIFRWR